MGLAGEVVVLLLSVVFILHAKPQPLPQDTWMVLRCPKLICYGKITTFKCSIPTSKCTPAPEWFTMTTQMGGPPIYTKRCDVNVTMCGLDNPPEGTLPSCSCVKNETHYTLVYKFNTEDLFTGDKPPEGMNCNSGCSPKPILTYIPDASCSNMKAHEKGVCDADELGKASKATRVTDVRPLHYIPGIILTMVNVMLLH